MIAQVGVSPHAMRVSTLLCAYDPRCGRRRRQKTRHAPGFSLLTSGVDQLTASFSALPALNDGFFDFWILIVSPVFGLRPSRAARSRTWKVPKPTRVTASPFFSALVMTL